VDSAQQALVFYQRIDMKKIYVTKYCLTNGIKCYDWDEESHSTNLIYPEIECKMCNPLYLGKEAFLTQEEAKQDAEKRRARKIASLQKQISRIEKLNFN